MVNDAQLLIRTWFQDLGWLQVCLQSVAKYWSSEFPPVIIATPECQGHMPSEAEELGCTVFFEPQWEDHRRGQCWLVFHADQFTDPKAAAIIFTDSDCLFNRPSSARSFCDSAGRPSIVYQRYTPLLESAEAPDHNCYVNYRLFVTEVLGLYPACEYMRAHPFLFYRSTIQNCREHVEARADRTLKQIMEVWHSGYSSEFNLLGAYAFFFEEPEYDFVLKGEHCPRIRQFHSYTQNPWSERAEINLILGNE